MEIREWGERFARIGTIRKAIMADHKTNGTYRGQLTCPACGTGTVCWALDRSNGHVHAKCSTPGCASWME